MACEIIKTNDNLLQQLIDKFGQKEGLTFFLKHNTGEVNAFEILNRKSKEPTDEISYELKSVNILLNLTDKVKVEFAKLKNGKTTIEKVVDNIQIPKEQKQFVIDSYNEGNKIPEQLAIDIASKYSYSVEVKTAISKNALSASNPEFLVYIKNGKYYTDTPDTGEVEITKEQYERLSYGTSQHYSNLTVPGGTNYTENRIITPQIVPSIKGHASFAEKEDIGWFRSDDKVINQSKISKYVETQQLDEYGVPEAILKEVTEGGEATKTRRILELQSDLFQKGRDKDKLIDDRNPFTQSVTQYENEIKQLTDKIKKIEQSEEIEEKEKSVRLPLSGSKEDNMNKGYIFVGVNPYSGDNIYEREGDIKRIWKLNNEIIYQSSETKNQVISSFKHKLNIAKENFESSNNKLQEWENNELFNKIKQNQFLQLLNKDNNWVTFFIKSIIQDSAKKGYEKVLFPKGETAAKIEGHETIAEEIRKIDSRIEVINQPIFKPVLYSGGLFGGKYSYKFNNETIFFDTIDELKQELEDRKKDLKSQGFEKLKPIEAFYEIKVGNILEKQFGKENVKTITDEYGNQWREIDIKEERDNSNILFSEILPEETLTEPTIDKKPEYIERIMVGIQRQLSQMKSLNNKEGINPKELATIFDKFHNNQTASALFDLTQYIRNMIGGRFIGESDKPIEYKSQILENLRYYKDTVWQLPENSPERIQKEVEYAEFLHHARAVVDFLKNINTEKYSNIETLDYQIKKPAKQLIESLYNLPVIEAELEHETINYFKNKLTKYSKNPEVIKGVIDIFTNEIDENVIQSNLAALADTNDTFIGVLMKYYEIEMEEARQEINTIKDEFDEMFEELKKKGRTMSYYWMKNKEGKMIPVMIGKYKPEFKEQRFKIKRDVQYAELNYGNDSPEYWDAAYRKYLWDKQNTKQEYNSIYNDYFNTLIANPKFPEQYNKCKEAWIKVQKIDREIMQIRNNNPDYYNANTGKLDYAAMSDDDRIKYGALQTARKKVYDSFYTETQLSVRKNLYKAMHDWIPLEEEYKKAEETAIAKADFMNNLEPESGTKYLERWYQYNSVTSFSDEFHNIRNEIYARMAKLKEDNQKGTSNIGLLYKEMKRMLSKYYVNGKLDIESIKLEDKLRINSIQSTINKELAKMKQKGANSDYSKEMLNLRSELDNIQHTIVKEEYQYDKMLASQTGNIYEWIKENTVDDGYGNKVPSPWYMETLPIDKNHIIEHSMGAIWHERKVKESYYNTKEGNKLLADLLEKYQEKQLKEKLNDIESTEYLKILLSGITTTNEQISPKDYYEEDSNGYALPTKEWLDEEYKAKDLDNDEWYQNWIKKMSYLLENTKPNIVHETMIPAKKKSNKSQTLQQEVADIFNRYNAIKKSIVNKITNKEEQEKLRQIATDQYGNIIGQVPFEDLKRLNQTDIKEITDDMSIEEKRKVMEENEEIYRQNKEAHYEATNENIENTIKDFVNTAIKFKYKKRLEADIILAREVMANRRIKKSGINFLDMTWKKTTNKDVPITVEGTQSNLYSHFNKWINMVFYENFEKNEGLLQDIVKELIDLTSLKMIGFNPFSALNNIAIGRFQLFMESMAGTYWGRDSHKNALSRYWKSAVHYYTDSNKKATTIEDAMIRKFDIMQSQDELSNTEDGVIKTQLFKLSAIKNAAFGMMHAGEHMMQNISLFAMMYENRIINGNIYNKREFIKYQTLENEKNNITQTKEELETIFDSSTRLADAYELDKGKAKLKKDIIINKGEESNFKRKVIAVNQYMHGIYNKEHASTLQHYALGRLFMQFKKHMYPALTKRFGYKFGKGYFNEHRELYEEGIYITTAKYLSKLFTDFNGLTNTLSENWSKLSDEEKANVRRTLTEVSAAIIGATLFMILLSLRKKLDDDDKAAKWLLNVTLYQLDRFSKENRTFNTRLIEEGTGILKNPSASISILSSTTNLAKELMLYWFRDESQAKDLMIGKLEPEKIKGGIYHGQDRLINAIASGIPGLSFINKFESMERNYRFRKMTN